ncbi:hypothetical protein TorRG33x02_121860 [Trema orientale]|uniref:Uncharacterized protein n=1 Tax=Trema orientale TaxID=63057 RepID=A0A2P5F2W1_TREOI|nr:hypothetical protein TorRG33x02_121860 [Trema orientale]
MSGSTGQPDQVQGPAHNTKRPQDGPGRAFRDGWSIIIDLLRGHRPRKLKAPPGSSGLRRRERKVAQS